MRILVLTTTGQPEANLESARHFIQNKSQIDKIAIISSQQMLKDGKTTLLQSSLKDICLTDTEIIELPQGYEESNMIGIQELIVAWAHAHPAKARFIFNVTGGTKLISLALDRASQLIGTKRAECFYQSRDHNIVWYQRHKDKIVYPIHYHLNLQQRIASRGYQITKQQPITDIAIEQLRYAQILIEVIRNAK